jgi:replication factor A1
MFIKDLQPRQTGVDVEGDVTEVSDVREFNKFGKQGRVSNAMIKDGTGRVKLSLWNEQTEKVKVGDKVKVKNGYVGEFQGELQLTTGKFGTLEVIRGEEPAKLADAPKPAEAPTPAVTQKKETEITSDELEQEESDNSLDVEEEDFN